jgi:hypothetical protein
VDARYVCQPDQLLPAAGWEGGGAWRARPRCLPGSTACAFRQGRGGRLPLNEGSS